MGTSPLKVRGFRRWSILATMFLTTHTFAGETYFTSFSNFTVGDDKIIGTESWLGSHAGLKLHGIANEAEHKVLGIGNAAYIGGNYATITSTNKTVYVRRPVNIDPLALNQEVATFSVVFGIKDSTTLSSNRRDNFEFLIYNQSLQLLGGIQFDNTTLSSNSPQRLIYRLSWNGTAFQYTNTGYTFLAESLETLQFRINYRTNRWTVTLGGVPLFQDITFYSGSNAKNLGSVLAQMKVTNTAPTTNYLMPGDNFMLFDDYTIRTDAVTTVLTASHSKSTGTKLSWSEEAGYSYRLQYSNDCKTWTDVAATVHTATVTANTSYTDTASAAMTKRFYRVKSVSP